MMQPKINSFFNHNSDSMEHGSSQPISLGLSQHNYGNKNSKKSCNSSQMYNDSIQTILRYKNSRRERHHEKLNEKIILNQNSDRSNESQLNSQINSQIMDDSQNLFMDNSSQSQDSPNWAPNKAGNNFQQRPRFRPYTKQTYVKHENFSFKHYTDSARQKAKEKSDKEMLHNFLLSAKQCCEQANDIASKMKESADQSSAAVILKVTECLENKVPKLLEKLLDEKNEVIVKLTEIQSEFKQIMEINGVKHSEHSNKVLTAVNDTGHLTKQSLQKMMSRMDGIMTGLNKPICHEVSSQYSPQIHTVDLPPIKQYKHTACFNPKQSPVATVQPFSFHRTGDIGIETRRNTKTQFQPAVEKTWKISPQIHPIKKSPFNQKVPLQNNFSSGESGCYNFQPNTNHSRNHTEVNEKQNTSSTRHCLYDDSSDDDQSNFFTFSEDGDMFA